MKIKIISYILLIASLLLSSCSHTQRKTTVKRQDAIETNSPKKILAKIGNMELPQLAEFYKENRYDFLRDTIAKKIFTASGSIRDLEGAAELFSFDDILYIKIQRHIEGAKLDLLEEASEMNLPQLSEFYKENQYNFLREAISESVSSLDGSVEDLQNAAELFSFDEQIYAVLQKRIEYIEEQQRKLYKKIYYNNCDSLLTALECIISEEIANYIGEWVSSSLIENIFENNLPEGKKAIDKKVQYWVSGFSHKIDDKLLSSFQQFVDEECTMRRDLVSKTNLPNRMNAKVDIDDIIGTAKLLYPHQNNTYSELYLISQKQNETDWLGWGLTAAEVASAFIPGGQLVSAGIGVFSAGRDVKNLYQFKEDMKRYGTAVATKIYNELQDESNKKIQYISNHIKTEIKDKLEL